MKRVLVTGATGFVGRASLVPLLRRGFEIHALTCRGPALNEAGVVWHQTNLLDPDAAKAVCQVVRPSHLLHFAWYAVPEKFWNALENFSWVRASLELLDAFRAVDGTRAVFAGTCAEYDWRHNGRCVEGITSLEPATTYGVCKAALARMTDAYARETGVSLAWGRIFFPFGPHEYSERLTSYVINALLRGEPAACTQGKQRRDFLFVNDVAAAFAALLDSGVGGPVNIGAGAPLSVAEFLQRFASRLGRPDLLKLGARPNAAGDAVDVVADVTRLHREVGWSPAYSLDEAIDRTIDYWRNIPSS